MISLNPDEDMDLFNLHSCNTQNCSMELNKLILIFWIDNTWLSSTSDQSSRFDLFGESIFENNDH